MMTAIATVIRQLWCGLWGHESLSITEGGMARCHNCGYERPVTTSPSFRLDMVYKERQPITDPLEAAKALFHEAYHDDKFPMENKDALSQAIDAFVLLQPEGIQEPLRAWIAETMSDDTAWESLDTPEPNDEADFYASKRQG